VLNTTAMKINAKKIKGAYKVRKKTTVQEVVTHCHSLELEDPPTKTARKLFFKNSE